MNIQLFFTPAEQALIHQRFRRLTDPNYIRSLEQYKSQEAIELNSIEIMEAFNYPNNQDLIEKIFLYIYQLTNIPLHFVPELMPFGGKIKKGSGIKWSKSAPISPVVNKWYRHTANELRETLKQYNEDLIEYRRLRDFLLFKDDRDENDNMNLIVYESKIDDLEVLIPEIQQELRNRNEPEVIVGGKLKRTTNTNAWVNFVRNFAKQNGITYMCAIGPASIEYRKLKGLKGKTSNNIMNHIESKPVSKPAYKVLPTKAKMPDDVKAYNRKIRNARNLAPFLESLKQQYLTPKSSESFSSNVPFESYQVPKFDKEEYFSLPTETIKIKSAKKPIIVNVKKSKSLKVANLEKELNSSPSKITIFHPEIKPVSKNRITNPLVEEDEDEDLIKLLQFAKKNYSQWSKQDLKQDLKEKEINLNALKKQMIRNNNPTLQASIKEMEELIKIIKDLLPKK